MKIRNFNPGAKDEIRESFLQTAESIFGEGVNRNFRDQGTPFLSLLVSQKKNKSEVIKMVDQKW